MSRLLKLSGLIFSLIFISRGVIQPCEISPAGCRISLENIPAIGIFRPGTDTSTSPFAPASDFLEKGLSGKYILVFTCPNRQADFLNTIHMYVFLLNSEWHKYLRNMQTIQQNWNEHGIQIFKSMINNTCLSSICYINNSFRASKKLFRASKNH